MLYKRPISMRAFRFPCLRKVGKKKSTCRARFRLLRRVLWPSRRSEDIDKVGELRSMTERVRAPCPSPITPAYIKMARLRRADIEEGPDEVEEACRSFENYLVEMIVEERKVLWRAMQGLVLKQGMRGD
ncbi:uncharacterized protein LOC113462414 [Phoenix dactylifera]|uniref:Uncharacterized protein LOC113462414 n=1 Tax=Phoenix dactylifera TaxID=42345 RepID=A0A8B9A9S8_PHODC|nr:uncharacterized protein LOC113462414 [Phoenix dactylifera]